MTSENKYWIIFPIAFVCALLAVVFFNLHKDTTFTASKLMGTEAPALPSASLYPEQNTSHTTLKGGVTVVNFFASWCRYCRQEHETIRELGRKTATHDFSLVGVNVNDKRDAARLWLGEVGNPYTVVLFDEKRAAVKAWGLTGTPSLFVVDPQGVIIYHYSGALSSEKLHDDILPLLPQRSHAPAP